MLSWCVLQSTFTANVLNTSQCTPKNDEAKDPEIRRKLYDAVLQIVHETAAKLDQVQAVSMLALQQLVQLNDMSQHQTFVDPCYIEQLTQLQQRVMAQSLTLC